MWAFAKWVVSASKSQRVTYQIFADVVIIGLSSGQVRPWLCGVECHECCDLS